MEVICFDTEMKWLSHKQTFVQTMLCNSQQRRIPLPLVPWWWAVSVCCISIPAFVPFLVFEILFTCASKKPHMYKTCKWCYIQSIMRNTVGLIYGALLNVTYGHVIFGRFGYRLTYQRHTIFGYCSFQILLGLVITITTGRGEWLHLHQAHKGWVQSEQMLTKNCKSL